MPHSLDSASVPSLADRLLRLPKLWFTFATPVRGLEYAVSGLLLTPLKFVLDSWVFGLISDKPWPWTSYINPAIGLRYPGWDATYPSSILAMALLTVPFVWIGMSMTVRRCMDADLSAKLSLLFFVPAVNYLLMITLCFVPSRRRDSEVHGLMPGVVPMSIRDVVRSVSLGAISGLVLLIASAVLLEQYGLALFIGAPFVMGSLSAFVLNRSRPHTFATTFGISQLTLLVASLAILMFALEGAGCLLMAYPIAMILSLMGAFLGYAVARTQPASATAMIALLFGLPLLLASDLAAPGPPLRQVTTTIEIDAGPDQVWSSVIGFPDLPPPTDIVFRSGIAYPVRARIEGTGVGAVRYCEFSTGSFVEPITAWEAPRRLAFDVTDQPLPMQELSPYEQIYAPHLLDGLVSHRGEFLLIARPDGGTELRGSTWYTVDFWPQAYWTLWSDAIIHRIHSRVLDHVRDVAEESPVH